MICVSITIMIVNSSVKSSFHCKYYVAEISLIIYFLIAINSPPRCAGHSICLQRVYILVILRRLADKSPIDVAYFKLWNMNYLSLFVFEYALF